MLRHQGGDHVKAGFYFNTESWEISTISGTGGGTLDGGADGRHLRIPVLAMLLFAPLMGALFAIFLPFIGIVLVAQFVAVRAWSGVRHVAHAMVVAVGPAWQPSAAHLSGTPDATKPETSGPPAPAAQARLDTLEQEIVEKKNDR